MSSSNLWVSNKRRVQVAKNKCQGNLIKYIQYMYVQACKKYEHAHSLHASAQSTEHVNDDVTLNRQMLVNECGI